MVTIADIWAARPVVAEVAVRTPLVRLQVGAAEAPAEIYLKLENLQPIGSFKLRGAYNAARRASPDELAAGLVTASAGNMAQGVAWAARELGVPCTVIAPDHAPQMKLAAIVAVSSSRINGGRPPTEFTWAPSFSHSRPRTGSSELVAATTTSAPRTASSALPTASAPASSASAAACSAVGL